MKTQKHNLDLLCQQAMESMEYRQHKVFHFHEWPPNSRVAWCVDCGMEVIVNACPMPHEIDIGGEALALDCTGVKQ